MGTRNVICPMRGKAGSLIGRDQWLGPTCLTVVHMAAVRYCCLYLSRLRHFVMCSVSERKVGLGESEVRRSCLTSSPGWCLADQVEQLRSDVCCSMACNHFSPECNIAIHWTVSCIFTQEAPMKIHSTFCRGSSESFEFKFHLFAESC